MRTMLCAAGLIGWVASAVAAAPDDGWRAVAHDYHEPMIDQALPRAKAMLERIEATAYGREEVPKVKALLEAQSVAKGIDAIVGQWRCASTQIDPSGVFAYPPFKCEISLTEDGTLSFRKTTGSQRRNGQLWPADNGSYVLLGGSSVNNDPYRSYSATYEYADGEDVEADTVGLLETLKDGRMRMVLDADEERVELYTLTR